MFGDSFYRARKTLFEHRLKEIEEGKAQEYLKRYDDRYRPERTGCIGLRWDAFEQKQLLEIIEVPLAPVYLVCIIADQSCL
jgi:Fanconi-associated nuclease 1